MKLVDLSLTEFAQVLLHQEVALPLLFPQRTVFP